MKKYLLLFLYILLSVYLIMVILISLNIVSWEILNTFAQWTLVVIGFFIPLLAIVFQEKLNKDKEDIKSANLSLLREINNTKSLITGLDTGLEKEMKISASLRKIDSLDLSQEKEEEEVDLKAEIYNFIDIAMMASTKEIADHFRMPMVKTEKLLSELALGDEKITTNVIKELSQPTEKTVWVIKR